MENNESCCKEEILKSITDHHVWIGNTIHNFELELINAHGRIDLLEANHMDQKEAISTHKFTLDRVERKLEKAEEQREKFNDYVASEVRELKSTVANFSSRDDERHEELVSCLATLSKHVSKLSKETAANSNYITEAEAAKRQEEYAQKKVDEVLAPKKKIKNQIIMTTIGVITVFVLGVLGKLGWMAVNLDELVTKAKVAENIK